MYTQQGVNSLTIIVTIFVNTRSKTHLYKNKEKGSLDPHLNTPVRGNKNSFPFWIPHDSFCY